MLWSISFHAFLLASLAVLSLGAPTSDVDAEQRSHNRTLEARQSSLITYVNLAANTGASVHRASGILYGVPTVQNQIPSSFYTGMGFNYLSSGGAQDPRYTGWIYGGYTGRFQGVLSNYRTARQHNAQFILKMSDIWGADGTQQSNAIWPGDNGNWAEYDRFLTQLVSDINANGMTAGLKLLIWNEPDLSIFWTVGQSRYLDTWTHTYRFLKARLPNVPIAGPSFAGQPSTSNSWWTTWLARIKADNTAPDIYTWHLEGDVNNAIDDLQTTQPAMVSMLNSYGLPVNEFVIDEYGVLQEQVPGGAAWWISRFERYNMYGLRGNWLGGFQLRDFLASLLGKSDVNSEAGTGYYANGEWQVYRYYATEMVGHRVATTGSGNRKMDCYAVVDSNRVRILVGGRQVTGTYTLEIDNLSAIGLPQSGTISVQTFQFNWAGKFGRVDSKQDLGYYDHTYSGNVLQFPIFQTDTVTTWAFEFSF